MGSAASILNQTNIYISCDERDVQGISRIQKVCDLLEKQEIFTPLKI